MVNALTSIFKPGGVTRMYNHAKAVFGKVYAPIKYTVHKVQSVVHGIDNLLNEGKSIPLVRDIVSLIQGIPGYGEVISLTDDVADAVDAGGKAGQYIDSQLAPYVGKVDSTLSHIASTPFVNPNPLILSSSGPVPKRSVGPRSAI